MLGYSGVSRIHQTWTWTTYRIFNVRMWSFCMRIHTGDHSLSSHSKDFCQVCTEYDSREISDILQDSNGNLKDTKNPEFLAKFQHWPVSTRILTNHQPHMVESRLQSVQHQIQVNKSFSPYSDIHHYFHKFLFLLFPIDIVLVTSR